jgi:formylglycine-generating enzyme required for sulfatase activity
VLGKRRTKFSFGDDPNKLIEYGWHDQNASSRGNAYAHPVGLLKPNQLNLFDMHGNIWEWTFDNDNGTRVLRGGGFNAAAELSASAFRVTAKPEMVGEAAGFRLIQEPK